MSFLKSLKSYVRWKLERRRLDREADAIIIQMWIEGVNSSVELKQNTRKWMKMIKFEARYDSRRTYPSRAM